MWLAIIALATITVIAAVAWWIQRDDPPPTLEDTWW